MFFNLVVFVCLFDCALFYALLIFDSVCVCARVCGLHVAVVVACRSAVSASHHYEHKFGPTGVRIKDYVRFFSLQRVAVDTLPHWDAHVLTPPTNVPFAPALLRNCSCGTIVR